MNTDVINSMIVSFVDNYHDSRQTETRWQTPLLAYASAADPLFSELRKIISPTHVLPGDLLADAQSVITFFIPFTENVNLSNINNPGSSREWAVAYIETNILIRDLNHYIHDELCKMGFDSSILPATHNFDETTLISDWSHKHVGYIAGLGRFGLHRMLITDRGCSGRLGSIVTNLKLEPTRRPATEYCLYYLNQSCRRCMAGCPNGALQIESFNRKLCYQCCLENAEKHKTLGLADVCGKCMAGMPCAFANPVKYKKEGTGNHDDNI